MKKISDFAAKTALYDFCHLDDILTSIETDLIYLPAMDGFDGLFPIFSSSLKSTDSQYRPNLTSDKVLKYYFDVSVILSF